MMMKIFIPDTCGLSLEKIKGLVERDLGKVKHVNIVYNTGFICLESWRDYDSSDREHPYPAFIARSRMENGEAHKIISYNPNTGVYNKLILLKDPSEEKTHGTAVS
jgi:hypothetical protein